MINYNKSLTVSSCRFVTLSLEKKTDGRPRTQVVHTNFLNIVFSSLHVLIETNWFVFQLLTALKGNIGSPIVLKINN